MVFAPQRPRRTMTKAGTVAGLYVIAALFAAPVSFAHLPGDWPTEVVVILVVAAMVVGQQLVRIRFWTGFGCLLAGGTLVITTFFGTHATVLALHGKRVTVVVTGRSVIHNSKSTSYLYDLTDLTGHRVPGQLAADFDDYSVGDPVVVVEDRGGWVSPETPGSVAAARPLWIAAFGSLVAALAIASVGVRYPPGGPDPEVGPGGIWIFSRSSGRHEVGRRFRSPWRVHARGPRSAQTAAGQHADPV